MDELKKKLQPKRESSKPEVDQARFSHVEPGVASSSAESVADSGPSAGAKHTDSTAAIGERLNQHIPITFCLSFCPGHWRFI